MAAPASSVPAVDPAQVSAVVRQHGPFVWRVLRHLGVEESLLEDACQEVFLVVCRKLSSFEGRASLRTWLYAIASKVARRAGRSHRRETELLTDEPPEVAAQATQAERVEQRELVERLNWALSQLDQRKRMVFVLFELEGVPMNEVAEIVGCTPSTAYARLYAARERIARALRRADALGSARPAFQES